MSIKSVERRRPNGSRLEGRALAATVANEINGMVLAQAYVAAKSAGFKLFVNKHDGVPRVSPVVSDGAKVMVDVINGFVRRAWASE